MGGAFIWYGILKEGFEDLKCNADERCPLRLDAAEP